MSFNRGITFTVICASLFLLFSACYWFDRLIPYEPFQQLENSTYDWRVRIGRTTPIDPRLVFIAIDKANYSHLYGNPESLPPELQTITKDWPWPRSVWATVVERVLEAGAEIIALDINLPSARDAKGDEALHQALIRFPNRVVIGGNIQEESFSQGRNEKTFAPPSPSIIGTAEDPLSTSIHQSIGYFNFWADPSDGVIRRVLFRYDEFNRPIYALTAKVLERLHLFHQIPSPTEKTLFRFSGDPKSVFRHIPLHEVIDPRYWKTNYVDKNFFKGKIVLLGPIGNWAQDAHPTPYSLMPGPKIHLSALNAAIHGEFIRISSSTIDLLEILTMALIAGLLSYFIPNAKNRLVAFVVANGTFFAASLLFYDYKNLAILTALPLLTLNTSGLLCFIYEYVFELREKARVRGYLERYVSKNVVKQLVDGSMTLGGRKPVTILFSDIRGFTTMTESADEQQLVTQLNEYLTAMVECVFKHNGTLDKFIGDAVMAHWGSARPGADSPAEVEANAALAVQTAIEMLSELKRLNEKWVAEGRKALQIGIGINHGTVITGDMGSPQRMEFTVIGDAVNLASRLEGLTKEYHTDLLLGETVAPFVKDKFYLRSAALVQVKGKTKPVEVWTVLGVRTTKNEPLSWLDLYHRGVEAYRRRAFAEALPCFEAGLQMMPDDFLFQIYVDSTRELIDHPPGPDWTGVTIMKSK